MSTTLVSRPVAPHAVRAARLVRPAPMGRRTAVFALVAGSVLNAAQALLARAAGTHGSSTAEWMAAAEATPALVVGSLATGLVGGALLLVAFQAVAHVVRPHAPRLARLGAGLTFAGWSAFLVMGGGAVAQLAAVDVEDRAGAVAGFEAMESSAAGAVVLLTFLGGVLLGALLLTVGLLRARPVARWIPLVWLAFLVLDFAAQSVMPVDPHVLFVAGAVGLAVHVARRDDEAWLSGSADGAQPAA